MIFTIWDENDVEILSKISIETKHDFDLSDYKRFRITKYNLNNDDINKFATCFSSLYRAKNWKGQIVNEDKTWNISDLVPIGYKIDNLSHESSEGCDVIIMFKYSEAIKVV
jgi:hypothetical protein